MSKIYIGDYGTIFRVSTGADLTDASAAKMKIKKPDNTEIEWTADIDAPASDGIISYTTLDGDLDSAGVWSLQSLITFPSGVWSGDTVTFTVYTEYK